MTTASIPTDSELVGRLAAVVAAADSWDPAQNRAALELTAATACLAVPATFVPPVPPPDMAGGLTQLLADLEGLPTSVTRAWPVGAVLSRVRAAARDLGVR